MVKSEGGWHRGYLQSDPANAGQRSVKPLLYPSNYVKPYVPGSDRNKTVSMDASSSKSGRNTGSNSGTGVFLVALKTYEATKEGQMSFSKGDVVEVGHVCLMSV